MSLYSHFSRWMMVLWTLKKAVVSRKALSSHFCFVYLLPSFVCYRSHMTLLASREGARVQNLMFLKNLI